MSPVDEHVVFIAFFRPRAMTTERSGFGAEYDCKISMLHPFAPLQLVKHMPFR